MPDEKPIRRLTVNPAMVNEFGKHGALSQSVDGTLVSYSEHLDALGEVERERDEEVKLAAGYRTIAQNNVVWWKKEKTRAEAAEKKAFDQHVMVGEIHTQLEAAEAKLETLRSGLKAEVERLKDWRNEPAETRRIDAVYLRLERLLDVSEDTDV